MKNSLRLELRELIILDNLTCILMGAVSYLIRIIIMMNNIIFRQMSPAEFKSTYCERVYLNKGEYGSVSRYKDSRTNKDVAIKELMKDHNLSTFRREVDTMMAVNHPNILTCSDYFYRNSDKTHCLVLEYCSKGSLKDN